ncbi:MAG: thioredoxin domain-containing protein [Planctomycetota bacterium]
MFQRAKPAITGAFALTLLGCGDAGPSSTAATPTATTAAASAEARTLPRIDLDGIRALVAEASANDQVVVIDFWATWCVPCVEMFPHLHSGLKEFGDRVVSVSVSFDSDDATPDGETYEAKAHDFLVDQDALKHGYITPAPADQEAIVDQLGPAWQHVAPPAVYVFGPDGELSAEFVGAPDPAATAGEIVARVGELVVAGDDATASVPASPGPSDG